MCAADLLARDPELGESDVRRAIDGNFCRCTGYHNIVRAVMAAAESMRAGEVAEVADSTRASQATDSTYDAQATQTDQSPATPAAS